MLEKPDDRGGEKSNREKESPFTEVGHTVTAGREQASIHTHIGRPASYSAIFLKMEHVVAVQDGTERALRVLQQSAITDFKIK